MKAIFDYGIDNMQVSAVKKKIVIGDDVITVHHTLRDGCPQIYWFSIHCVDFDFEYVDFDIRDYWRDNDIPEFGNWMEISDSARLTLVAQMAENGFRVMGFNMLDSVKKHSPSFPENINKMPVGIPF